LAAKKQKALPRREKACFAERKGFEPFFYLFDNQYIKIYPTERRSVLRFF
jgi:hypothetical protein